jgi:hypothetical protein
MNVSEGMENADRKMQVCSFLGLGDDPATALSYPSSLNRCFHARPVLPVKLEFQRNYCLAINHTNCQEFNCEPDNPLPKEMRFIGGSGLIGRFGRTGIWIMLLAFVVVVLIIWQVLSHGFIGLGSSKQLPEVTIPGISTVGEFQPTSILPTGVQDTPIPTILVTNTPTFAIQTFAPTIVTSHALETPIGVEYKLVIHKVLAGESIMSIANQYWTTVEAIQAINYNLPSPLRIDWLIIIPVNRTDTHGLPSFDAYEVKTEIAVRTLAQQLSIDPALLELYNGLGNNEFLSSGEWVLVPHMSTATP